MSCGIRARAHGGVRVGRPRCERTRTITPGSSMAATIFRLPPHSKRSTRYKRRIPTDRPERIDCDLRQCPLCRDLRPTRIRLSTATSRRWSCDVKRWFLQQKCCSRLGNCPFFGRFLCTYKGASRADPKGSAQTKPIHVVDFLQNVEKALAGSSGPA